MKYSEYRDNIRSGDVVAWSHRGIKSFYDLKIWFVRLFTRSEYTHVGIVWRYKSRIFIIESVIPYIRIVPLSNFLPCYVIHMNKDLGATSEEVALKLVGVGKYSQWEAIKAYFSANKDPDAWQCVEFVKKVLEANNTFIESKDTPSDFILELQKISGNMVYLE